MNTVEGLYSRILRGRPFLFVVGIVWLFLTPLAFLNGAFLIYLVSTTEARISILDSLSLLMLCAAPFSLLFSIYPTLTYSLIPKNKHLEMWQKQLVALPLLVITLGVIFKLLSCAINPVYYSFYLRPWTSF